MAPPRASLMALAIVFSGLVQSTTGSGLRLNSTLGIIREAYTTNAICAKKKCINPIFPGMEDLHKLNEAPWFCSSLQKTSHHMGFCKNAIAYDPALPVTGTGALSVEKLVRTQDNAASTMFYYHLSGLGLEAWDYQKPEEEDDCIKSIWRMVCYTYFPRAKVGCQEGATTDYIRPCQSSCFNYIRTCQVECCDESVQCVFEHTKALDKNKKITTSGYVPHDGPSAMCTGGAERSTKPFGVVFWAVVAVVIAMSLQGCNYDIPTHNVGNWRGQKDYLIRHQFVPPGKSAKSAILNSCADHTLSQSEQCSGRGVCKTWDATNLDSTLTFCDCYDGWADPECRTKRKSQLVAYVFALFFGFLGVDQFYLGHIAKGVIKLCSCGGFGVLWVIDIVTIGSSPAMTSNFRTSNDLPHYLFVLTATLFAIFLGFAIAYVITILWRHKRRQKAMQLQMQEEVKQWQKKAITADGMDKPPVWFGVGEGPPGMGEAVPPQYGTMTSIPPMGGPMGSMPPTMGPMGSMPPAYY